MVSSALKMRNFTLIFLKKILGGNPQPSVLGAFPTPPTKLASCAPAYINLTIKFSIMYKVCLLYVRLPVLAEHLLSYQS